MKVIRKITRFFAGVILEIKRVKWPTMKELGKYSMVVIPFMVFFAAFSYVITIIFAKFVEIIG